MTADLSACKSGCRVGVEVRVEAVAKCWSVEAAAGKGSRRLLSQLPKLSAQSNPPKAPELSVPKFFPFCTGSPDASEAAFPEFPLRQLTQAGGLC